MTEKRLLFLYCCIFAFATVIEAKMISLMCSGYDVLAEKQTVRTVDISMGRADIADCNLNKITGTENQVKAFITSRKSLQNIYENILPQDREKFYTRIQQQKQVVVDLTVPLQTETIYTTSKRYSSSNLASHLIGYTDLDGNGLTGIERAYNDILKDKGEKISVHFNVNGNGDIYGDIYSTTSLNYDVLSLTIDNSMQRMAESIAQEYITDGSIVIMESKTGKIRAMASVPTYDANNLTAYLEGENSPLVNKALQSYEPGSVIKPLWAAVLLEQGFDENKIYTCKGYTTVNGHTYHCANNRAHGEIDMKQALIVSCNCYFIDAEIDNKGFIFRQMANLLDFGESIELCDNLFTAQGNFPSVKQIENMGVQSTVCFGQGNFRLTPIHTVSFMNIFANKGEYVSPQIVEGVFDGGSGANIKQIYKYNSKKVLNEQIADNVKEMLTAVVHESVSDRRRPIFLKAAGKTGTAQTGKIKEDGQEVFTAWFCGFYPADEPQYTICVTMYDGGESYYSAAPVFKKICDSIYFLKYAENET